MMVNSLTDITAEEFHPNGMVCKVKVFVFASER